MIVRDFHRVIGEEELAEMLGDLRDNAQPPMTGWQFRLWCKGFSVNLCPQESYPQGICACTRNSFSHTS